MPTTPPRAPLTAARGETPVVILVALELAFLPWAYGGVDAWSQITGLALALAAFAMALRAAGWKRLRTFPIFWAGSALLGYVALQSLNPAFRYASDDVGWWLVAEDHVRWLPAGMSAPFTTGNGWRTMLVWGACWLTVCAIWSGVRHESSLLLILTVICGNALLLGVFGAAQRWAGFEAIYGARAVSVPYFFAAFIYKHHAAAYFSLIACTATGLMLRTLSRRNFAARQPGHTAAWGLCLIVAVAAVVLSRSWIGVFLLGVCFLALSPAISRGLCLARRRKFVATVFLVTTAAAVAIANYGDSSEKVWAFLSSETAQSVRLRVLATEAGANMFRDRWLSGWGAGCFSYGFTKYQKPEPELARWQHLKLRWEHLHNDWLELLIELGVLGLLPIAFIIYFWIERIANISRWRDLPRCVLAGVAVVTVHALIDFPLQSPAVLLTAGTLLTIIVQIAESEQRSCVEP